MENYKYWAVADGENDLATIFTNKPIRYGKYWILPPEGGSSKAVNMNDPILKTLERIY